VTITHCLRRYSFTVCSDIEKVSLAAAIVNNYPSDLYHPLLVDPEHIQIASNLKNVPIMSSMILVCRVWCFRPKVYDFPLIWHLSARLQIRFVIRKFVKENLLVLKDVVVVYRGENLLVCMGLNCDGLYHFALHSQFKYMWLFHIFTQKHLPLQKCLLFGWMLITQKWLA